MENSNHRSTIALEHRNPTETREAVNDSLIRRYERMHRPVEYRQQTKPRTQYLPHPFPDFRLLRYDFTTSSFFVHDPKHHYRPCPNVSDRASAEAYTRTWQTLRPLRVSIDSTNRPARTPRSRARYQTFLYEPEKEAQNRTPCRMPLN